MNTVATDKRYNFCVNYADNTTRFMKSIQNARPYHTPEQAHREMQLERIALARRRCLVMSSYVYEEKPYVTR